MFYYLFTNRSYVWIILYYNVKSCIYSRILINDTTNKALNFIIRDYFNDKKKV